MEDIRYMLLAIYSRGAALERVAGIKGVVLLLLEFTSFDEKWLTWQRTLRTYSPRQVAQFDIKKDGVFLDHFLRRLSYYPRITQTETDTALCLVDYVRRAFAMNWSDHENLFYSALLTRIFELFRNAPLQGHLLTRTVYKIQGNLQGHGRFATCEVARMDFDALQREGIEIVRIHHDFKGCDAVLTTSRKEWVEACVQLPNDYPFRCPNMTFKGSLRPRRFSKRQTICVHDHYDYAFCAVEDSLRAVLLDMETGGVMSTDDPTAKVLFV